MPRIGGILDQDYGELIRLELILDAFNEREELEQRKTQARNKNREKHR